jgi:hypothetical protein
VASRSEYTKEYCSDDVERCEVRREVEGDESTQEYNTTNRGLIVLYLEGFRSRVGSRSEDDQRARRMMDLMTPGAARRGCQMVRLSS